MHFGLIRSCFLLELFMAEHVHVYVCPVLTYCDTSTPTACLMSHDGRAVYCFFSKIDKSIRGCSESRDQNRKFSVLETILPQTRCSGFEIIPHTLHVLMPSTQVNLLQQLRVYHWDWTWSLALRTVTAGTRGAPPQNTCSLYRIENKSCVMEMSPSFSVWLIQCAATKEEDGRGQKEKLGWMEQSGGLKPV